MKHIVLRDSKYNDFILIELWTKDWIYILQNEGFPVKVDKRQVKKLKKALKKWLKENK